MNKNREKMKMTTEREVEKYMIENRKLCVNRKMEEELEKWQRRNEEERGNRRGRQRERIIFGSWIGELVFSWTLLCSR